MREEWLFVTGMVAFLAVLVSGLTWATAVQCHSQATAMRVPVSWGLWQGCMITVRGQTIPIKSYRVIY